MRPLRVLWTVALPFFVHWALARQFIVALLVYLVVGLVLNLLLYNTPPDDDDYMRLLDGFAPILSFSMALSICFVTVATWWFDIPESAKLLPAVGNFAFMLVFGASLLSPTPCVERFARAVDPELSDAEVHYCRRVTWVWVLFFALNALLIIALALSSRESLWTWYTGVGGYVAAGLLGATEYTIRKKRFGRYSNNPIDRLLKRLFTKADPA